MKYSDYGSLQYTTSYADPIIVISGTRRQAIDWAYYHNLGPSQIRYPSHANDLRGLRDGTRFAVTGNWWYRSDAAEIHEIVKYYVTQRYGMIYGS